MIRHMKNDIDCCSLLETIKLYKAEGKEPKKPRKGNSNDIDIDEFEKDMGWESVRRETKKFNGLKKELTNVTSLKTELAPIDEVLAKTAIKPGFEQLETVPPYHESKRALMRKKREQREKTKGKKWFDLAAPEVTDEVKHDLEVIQMRSVLDPKHFYKKNDLKTLPKYFQVGKVIDSPLDFYSGRLTKKERKKTIVDELMTDAVFSKYNRRKYKEIIEEKRKLHHRVHKHAKRLKGKRGKNK